MNYYMPTRLYCGSDCVRQHAKELYALGDCCLVVTEGQAAKASGALDDVSEVLSQGGVRRFVWEGVTPNPPVANCMEAGRRFASEGVRYVVGIGGGSALDAAKAVAVFAANPTLDEAGFYAFAWDVDPLPIVLVGTTAGTGSEVTKVSVLTDSVARKHSIHDDRLYATLSFGDSTYTHSCPSAVTLSCGVDVIAHATESYFSHKADEVSRAFAIRATMLAIDPLTHAMQGAELNDEQRRQLYEASILGGLAINTTGTCFPHNVGYYLTENYGVPHGFACAIFLPQMISCVRSFDEEYANAFFRQVGIDEESFCDLVRGCVPKYDITMTDAQIQQGLPRWENNGSVQNTRASVSVEDIHKMLLHLFARQ